MSETEPTPKAAMDPRRAGLFATLGMVLFVLTIPIYFLDLLVFAPNSKQCDGTGNTGVVMLVFFIGVLCWVVGVVFSGIAITQKASRVAGIAGAVIALVLPLAALPGLFLLTAGECVPEPAALSTVMTLLGLA